MTTPYLGDEERRRRRAGPRRRRGIADLLADPLDPLAATSLGELAGGDPFAPEATAGPAPRAALPSLEPERQAEATEAGGPRAGRDMGVETSFATIPREQRRPSIGAMLDQATQRPDATATPARPSGRPATEDRGETSYYRDPMAVAQSRGQLQRIADGREATRPDGRPYTDEERAQAAAFDQNLRARIDREEAKGGFGRRALNAFAFGNVNAPLEREINEARHAGNIVGEDDLRSLDVQTREGETLRTEPTFMESAREEMGPTLLGELPWYLAGPIAAEGRLLARAGGAMAKQGGRARTIGEALGRVGRDEITATTFLERTGQRAVRGSIQGQVPGMGLSTIRQANEGRTADEIAGTLPLEAAIGGAAGAVLDPVFGAAAEGVRAGARALRPRTVADMDIPADVDPRARSREDGTFYADSEGRTSPDLDAVARAQSAAERAARMRPTEQADANVQMLAEMEIATGVRATEEFRAQEQARAEQAARQEMRDEPLHAAVARMHETARSPDAPDAEAAREYEGAINKYIDAFVAHRDAPEEHKRPGTKIDIAFTRAMLALNEARRSYGQQTGAAAILGLAANNDDLTDEEKQIVGLGALAMGTTALVPAGGKGPGRFAARLLGTLGRAGATEPGVVRPAQSWSHLLADEGARNPVERSRIQQVLALAVGREADDVLLPDSGDLSLAQVQEAILSLEDPEVDVGRAPLYSRLVRAIEGLKGPAWEKPRPAADWIGKLKGLNTLSKTELGMILPVLEAAQAEKRKTTHAEVLTLAWRLAPEVEMVTFEGRGGDRVAAGDADAGNADDLGDIDAIEADVRGGMEVAEAGPMVQQEIDNRAARIAEIEEGIEREVSDAQAKIDGAETEHRRVRNDVENDLESAGIPIRAYQRAFQHIDESVEGDHIQRGTLDRAMEMVSDYIDPPDDADAKSIFDDADYEVGPQRELVIYRRRPRRTEVERLYLLPGEDPDVAFNEWKDGHAEEGVEYTHRVAEDPDTWVAFDNNGDKAGEGSDKAEAVAEAIRENDLDQEWRDEKYGEVKGALERYIDSYQSYRYVDSENYYIVNYDDYVGGPFVEVLAEAERLRGDEIPRLRTLLEEVNARALAEEAARERGGLVARTRRALGIGERDEPALEAAGQQTLLPAEAGTPETGKPEGEPVAIVPSPTEDLNPATNPYLMPLAPANVRGKPAYASYQRIGGRPYDYAELVNVWVNRPEGIGFEEGHYGGQGTPHDAGHLRVETHNVSFTKSHQQEFVTHETGEPDDIRHLIDEINVKRRARNADLDGMTGVMKEYDRLPPAQREGERAHELAQKYKDLSQHAADLSARESELRADLDARREKLAGEHGIVTNARRPVRVMIESQSDWSQAAHREGIKRGRTAADDARLAELSSQSQQSSVDIGELESRFERWADAAAGERPDTEGDLPETYRPSGDIGYYGNYGPNDSDLARLRRAFPDSEGVRIVDEYIRDRARAVRVQEEMAEIEAIGSRGVAPSPFLEDNAAYTLNAARFLIDSAERGYEQIAWSDGANRMRHAHLDFAAAVNVYDKYTPAAVKRLLGSLGFKDIKIEKLYIEGSGHWMVELTPAMRVAIRRVGLYGLGLALLVGSAEEAGAQEPGESVSPKQNLSYLLGTATGAAIATGAFAFLARRRAARLAVQNNPALRGALTQALAAMSGSQRRAVARPDFAFQRVEPRGTEYEAPIDVTETPSGKGPAQFNVAKIGLSPEGEGVWREIVEDLALKKRYVSWDETQAEADRRTTDIETLLREKPWRGTDALAARLFQSQASERLAGLANSLRNTTPEEATIIQAEMDRLTTDIADVATRAAGEREAAGRTLNSYKIIARHTLDEATWQTLAQRAKGELPLTSEEILKVRSFVQRRDREALTALVSGLHVSSKLDQWLTFWKAGLLTGFGTHAVNVVSNAVEGATLAASQPTAVAVDAMVALVRGTERTKALPKGMILARLRGFKTGVGEAKNVMRTGLTREEIGKWDVRRTNYKNPILQAYTQTIFRLLAAGDRPFYHAALGASIDELATVYARQAVRADPSLKFDQVKAALVSDPPNELAARAADEATRAVFQNDGTLAAIAGGAIGRLREGGKGKAAARAFVETTLPFTRTPSNVATRFVDSSPLGFVTAIMRQVGGDFDQRRFSEDIARALTGSGGLMLLGYWLAERGEATGSVPTSPSEREVWWSLGKQAHSIKLGDRWYNAARVGPPGMVIVMGAELHAIMRENPGNAAALAGGMAGTVGRVMLDQSYLRGVSSSLATIADPVRRGESFTAGLAGSVVPALVGRAARASEDTLREGRGPADRVRSRIPGASKGLRPRLNVFGDAMTQTTADRVATMIDPFFSVRERDEPILKELDRLSAGVPRLPKTRRITDPETGERVTVTYTDAEQHAALRAVGPIRRDVLTRLMTSPAYATLPDEERRKEARRMLGEADDEFFARDDARRLRRRPTRSPVPQE